MLQYGENWMLITNLCNEHWFQELKSYVSSLLKNQLLKANIFNMAKFNTIPNYNQSDL